MKDQMMKHMLKVFVLMALAMTVVAGAAQAALTSDDVGKFISAIPEVDKLSEKLKKEGKDKDLEEAVKPKPGENTFSPYEKGVVMMKSKFPEDYKTLNDIATKNGFESAEKWAAAGDSVMLAYMATKIEKENPEAMKQIQNITPEAKAKLPPETRAQVERAEQMMKLVSTAPAADKEAVKPHLAKIDEWLKKSAEREKAAAPATAKPAEPAKKP